jgi:hypothetical protein
MSDWIKRYASIIIVVATFIALALFPIPWCVDCEFPNPYGLDAGVLAHRELLFDIWSVSAIFFSVFLRIRRPWLIPLGIMIADLMTQHLGGVTWQSLRDNEGPFIILFDLVAGFTLLVLAFFLRMGFERLRDSRTSPSTTC